MAFRSSLAIAMATCFFLLSTSSAEAKRYRYVGRYSAKRLHSSGAYRYRKYTYYSRAARKTLSHYAIYYNSRRHRRYIYYYNPRKRKYWGRLNVQTCSYSLLANKDKKEKLSDIPENAFPEEAELPPPEPGMATAEEEERMLPPPEVVDEGTKGNERQFYTEWCPDLTKKRWISFYFFKSNPDDEAYQRQMVVFYADKEKRLFLYYFNEEKKKFWGRCVSKFHEQFRPDTMVWNFASKEPGRDWGPLTVGDPPIPGSKNKAAKMKMYPRDLPPDPPM